LKRREGKGRGKKVSLFRETLPLIGEQEKEGHVEMKEVREGEGCGD